MQFQFDDVLEFDALWGSVHDSILYWKKVKQDAQGKITLSVDGVQTHYSVEYADSQIVANAELLRDIENAPHPEWDGEKFVEVSNPEFHSAIIHQILG